VAEPPAINIAAELIKGPVATDHLLLLLDEPIDSTSIPDPGAFTWHAIVPGPVVFPIPPIPPDVPAVGLTFLYEGFRYNPDLFPRGMSLLRLDLGASVDPAATVYLSYTPGTRPIRDVEGGEMQAFGGSSAVGASFASDFDDAILPFVDDGLGPDHVMLIALEPFDPALPAPSDFTVTVNGNPVITTSIVRQIPGNGLGVLDLHLQSAVAAGDAVRLSYAPGVTPLRYLSGVDVGPLTSLDATISLPATASRGTPTGSNVIVTPPDSSTGTSTTTITFASVSSPGTTTVASSATGPAAPAGFAFADPPRFVELGTTATFTTASVCFAYDPSAFTVPETALRLLHFQGGSWVDTTTPGSPDIANHRICGTVSSFSPFVVAAFRPVTFSGFFTPVDNGPTVNAVKAGSAVPVRFGLAGNHGLSIFASGSPSSRAIDCNSQAPIDDIEQTVSPGSASLTYDSGTGRYTYVWKTDKSWVGCRLLSVTFLDGTTRSATFRLR
jgi:hypothetical protein